MTTGRYPVTDYLPGKLQTLRSISQGSHRDAVSRPCLTLCSVYLDGAACVALACDAATPPDALRHVAFEKIHDAPRHRQVFPAGRAVSPNRVDPPALLQQPLELRQEGLAELRHQGLRAGLPLVGGPFRRSKRREALGGRTRKALEPDPVAQREIANHRDGAGRAGVDVDLDLMRRRDGVREIGRASCRERVEI